MCDVVKEERNHDDSSRQPRLEVICADPVPSIVSVIFERPGMDDL